MEKRKIIDWRFRPPFGSYLGGPLYPNGSDITPEQVLNLMDKAGVEIAVCPFRAGMDNADSELLYQINPDRFKCLIHIDPWDGRSALADIDKYVTNGHAIGVIIEPGQIHIRKPMHVNNPMLYPLYEKCEQENILLTITYGGMMNRNPELYMPHYLAQVCDDFPKLKIVVSHGGWPWVAGICHVAYNHEFLYISPDAYLSRIQPGYQGYISAATGWLQDKILFGSAFAYYGNGEALQANISEYLELLPESVLDKVLYHNAAGLLGIEPLTKFNPIG